MRDKELPFIQNMFNAIAPNYDLLNRLLSLRRDVAWRNELVRRLNLKHHHLILDAACGTADVALAICNTKFPVRVVGLDFAPQMLLSARQKIISAKKTEQIALLVADALSPPFKHGTFDAITIAFGIRNIVDKEAVLSLFFNLLKPGGRLLVLELTTPSKRFFHWAYLIYFQKILPLIGAYFSKHMNAYTYLPQSVIQFPPAETFAQMISMAGFNEVQWRPLTFGIATLFWGVKSASV